MEVLFIILACWLLTYFLHSTAFYGLAKLIALTPIFAHNRAKEILWKVAICGGLFTASVQVFTGTGMFTSAFINNTVQSSKESQSQTKVLINPILGENNASKVAKSPILGVQTNINQSNDGEVLAGLSKTSIKDNLTNSISYLSSHNRLFIIGVSIWGLIATMSFVRLLRQKHLFFRSILPRHKVTDEDLLYTLFKLCSWGGIEQKIVLTFSKNLFSPLAIGRGEICLPERSFTELSPEQQKSMLAHELAHIVRKDFVWLRLFNFLETILFFQPLNRLMRVELQEVTEQRCDEWAIRSTGASKPLADCLVKVAEWLTEPNAIRFASGMALHQSSLRQRIKNILKNQYLTQQKLNRMKVIVLLALLLLLTTFILPGKTWLSVSFAHDSKLANLYNHHEISIGEQETPATAAELEDIDAVSEIENIELPTSPEFIEEVPVIVSALHEEEMVRVGDTLRFGKDFMLITKGNGNFEIYKDGKYVMREDYEKYKEDFIVKNDNSIEILSKSGIRVSTGNDDYAPMFPKWNLGMGESLPALAPLPRWNGGFSGGFSRSWGAFGFSDDDYTYSWTEDGEEMEAEFDKEDKLISLRINDKEIEKADFPKYQKSIDKAKESIKKNREELKNYEREMSNYEAKMRDYEVIWQKAMKENEANMRKVERGMEEVQRKQEAIMREQEGKMLELNRRQEAQARKMEIKAREIERKHRANMDKILDEMIKDGLIKSKSSHYEIRLNKRGLFIDDEKQSEALYQKYKNLLKELNDIDVSENGSFIMNN